jgi:hypothetical protein
MIDLIVFVPFFIVGMVLFLIYLYSIIWSYADAEERGKPGCLVALVVALLSWPLGLILWVVFRPEKHGRTYY